MFVFSRIYISFTESGAILAARPFSMDRRVKPGDDEGRGVAAASSNSVFSDRHCRA